MFTSAALIEKQDILDEQAHSLHRLTGDLVRKTTMRGVATGAVVGCGLSALSGGAECVRAALVGGAVGGVAGHALGKEAERKRVEIVNLNGLLPTLRKTSAEMDKLRPSVTDLLNAQKIEERALVEKLAKGEITAPELARQMDVMRETRAALAESLTLSAEQVREARLALEDAKSKGQKGLEWYLLQVGHVEEKALSSRQEIRLF